MSNRTRGLMIGFLVLAGLVVVAFAFAVKPFQVPSEAMKPTLNRGDRFLVNKLSGAPEIGDIVVFHPPTGADAYGGKPCGVRHKSSQVCPEGTSEPSEQNFVKRVVAGPGDELSIVDGHPVVNGEKADEDFIRKCGSAASCNLPDPITVPEDQYFMLGDNRGSSDDSRFWGPVPEEWIVGEVFWVYWPPGDARTP